MPKKTRVKAACRIKLSRCFLSMQQKLDELQDRCGMFIADLRLFFESGVSVALAKCLLWLLTKPAMRFFSYMQTHGKILTSNLEGEPDFADIHQADDGTEFAPMEAHFITVEKLFGARTDSLSHYWVAPKFRAQYPWQPGQAADQAQGAPFLRKSIKVRRYAPLRDREFLLACFGLSLAWLGCLTLVWAALDQMRPILFVWVLAGISATGTASVMLRRLYQADKIKDINRTSKSGGHSVQHPSNAKTAGPNRASNKKIKPSEIDANTKTRSDSDYQRFKVRPDKPPEEPYQDPELQSIREDSREPEEIREFSLFNDPLIGPVFVEIFETKDESAKAKYSCKGRKPKSPNSRFPNVNKLKNAFNGRLWPKPWKSKWHDPGWNDDLIPYN